MDSLDNLEYWKAVDRGDYAFIYCPTLTKGVKRFGEKIKVYKEFQKMEELLKKKFFWWVGYTKLENSHIMRMFVKVGAQPFYINLRQNAIWFMKDISSKEIRYV